MSLPAAVRLVVLGLALAAPGCSQNGAAPPPLAGGGEHRITAITLIARDGSGAPLALPATVRVGAPVTLGLRASWAIPYVGDLTDREGARLASSDASIGEVDADWIFHPKKPGKATVSAVVGPPNARPDLRAECVFTVVE